MNDLAPVSGRIQIIAPGVYDLSAEDYHADPVGPEPSLSASQAKLLVDATPLHAWAATPRLNPNVEREEKAAFDLGRAAHKAMTGKGGPVVVVDAKDWRTKAAQEARDAAYAAGATPLLAEQAVQVRTFVQAARRQMREHGIGDPFEGGENEMSLIWRQDDVWNRAMVDTLDTFARVQTDLKTSHDYADPARWIRRSMEYGLDIRAAHYLDGTAAIYGAGWVYRCVVVETKFPHALSVVELDAETIDLGRRKLAYARDLWRRSLDTGVWPAWSHAVVRVGAPEYHVAKWLGREGWDDSRRAHPPLAIAGE